MLCPHSGLMSLLLQYGLQNWSKNQHAVPFQTSRCYLNSLLHHRTKAGQGNSSRTALPLTRYRAAFTAQAAAWPAAQSSEDVRRRTLVTLRKEYKIKTWVQTRLKWCAARPAAGVDSSSCYVKLVGQWSASVLLFRFHVKPALWLCNHSHVSLNCTLVTPFTCKPCMQFGGLKMRKICGDLSEKKTWKSWCWKQKGEKQKGEKWQKLKDWRLCGVDLTMQCFVEEK